MKNPSPLFIFLAGLLVVTAILSVSAAVEYPTSQSVLSVSGNLTPDATGDYFLSSSTCGGEPYYFNSINGYYLYSVVTDWVIYDRDISFCVWVPALPNFRRVYTDGIIGGYTPYAGATGTANVSWANITNYTIYDCGNITEPGTYTLNQSISATGTCLQIQADNVMVDGTGFTITGDGTGYGINASVSGAGADAHTNITIQNLTLTGFIVDVSAIGMASTGNGGAGGNLTILNSAIPIINCSGGKGDSDADGVGDGGKGGEVLINNSNMTILSSDGGRAVGKDNGGQGGKVTVTHSNIATIMTTGGTNMVTGAGNPAGSGGTVILTNSIIGTVIASGASGVSGGSGGAITSTYSNVTNIISIGGNGLGLGGSGGIIDLMNSTINTITSRGGTGNMGAGGSGGNLTIFKSFIYLNEVTNIDLTAGSSLSTGNGYKNGTLNFTQSTIYNVTIASITFLNVLTQKVNLNSILKLANNFAYIDSANYADYNTPATITLYGLRTNFTNPAILKDGVVCTDCYNFTSLNAGTVVFNVSSWSNYSIGEIDTLLPQINLIYPLNTSYNINVSALNYIYSDSNPGYCWYSLDGGVANSSRVNAGINFTIVAGMENSNTWTLYCNDSAGNWDSRRVTFFEDTIYPTINFAAPTEASGRTITARNIIVNLTANDTNLKNITLYLYNSSRALINSTISIASPLYANFSGLANGLYFFNATAYDIVGNPSSTETRNITLNSPTPSNNIWIWSDHFRPANGWTRFGWQYVQDEWSFYYPNGWAWRNANRDFIWSSGFGSLFPNGANMWYYVSGSWWYIREDGWAFKMGASSKDAAINKESLTSEIKSTILSAPPKR